MHRTLALLLLIPICFLLVSCSIDTNKNAEILHDADYAIGVVKTSFQKKDSSLQFYDGNLNLLADLDYHYAGVTNEWYKPVRFDDDLYLVAKGVDGGKLDRVALGFNLITGKVSEYPIGQDAIQGIVANQRFIFVIDNLNGTTHVTRCDKATLETLTFEKSQGFFQGVFVNNDTVFAFFRDDNLAQTVLYVLDENLIVQASHTLGDKETYLAKLSDIIDGELYFTTLRLVDIETQEHSYSLLAYSLANKTIRQVAESDDAFEDVIKHDEHLIVQRADKGDSSVNRISFLDPQTGQVLNEIRLGYLPQQILTQDDRLYVSGYYMTGGNYECLVEYKISGTDLELLHEVDLDDSEHGGPAYVSGIFLP